MDSIQEFKVQTNSYSAKEVVTEWGFAQPGEVVEEVRRSQSVVAQVIVARTVPLVGAAARAGVHLHGEMPELGRIGVGLDLELLDGVHGWEQLLFGRVRA